MKNLPKVRAAVEKLKTLSDVSVVEKDAWIVRIPKRGGLECEITIPIDWCFEWFTRIKKDGKECWSDWMEHHGLPDKELDSEMAEAILSYVDRVMQSALTQPVRMYEEGTSPDSKAKGLRDPG